jgi:hypothetical protein
VHNGPTYRVDPYGQDDVKVDGDIWRRYKSESAGPPNPHQTRGDHYHNTRTGDRYWPERKEIAKKKGGKEVIDRASNKFAKKFVKALAKKVPVVTACFFAYDAATEGIGPAFENTANDALWPLSELWTD